MKTPSRDPSDFHVTHGAEATLQEPEKTKCSRTPKRFRHMITFAFFEVGLINRIVRVGFAFDLNVSLNGRVTSGQQSHFLQYAVVVARFPEDLQLSCPSRSKYFCLSQPRDFSGCLRRAHCHRLKKIVWSTRWKTRLLTACR
jgi:hypothetical protein